MIDDNFDDLLRDAAQSYNTPPEPPREAMWAAISAARDATTVVPVRSVRPVRRWIPLTAAAAAVLLLGIAIGRFTQTGDVAGVTRTAVTPAPLPTVADSVSSPVATDLAFTEGSSDPAPQRTKGVRTRSVATARRPSAATAQRGALVERENAAGDATAYRFAVVEHLTRAEVLLTGFRSQAKSAEGAKLDAQFASLARELLGTTRVLLATRGTDDPAITRLLEDLELVLMQLSQYARDGRRIDLDAINQSLDKRNVLPKLRSTIPAGVSASAGT